jgi:glyoxylase-like metal-dependent hydrolase (beta-lactamase superfamily II)
MDSIPIHAHNPGPMTGDGNWTWLLKGRVTTLVDAGTGDATYLDAVAAALDGAALAQVLVTHAHGDHSSGAVALRDRFPGVRFRKMPWPGRDAKWPVDWDPIVPGELIQAGDGELSAVHTPGHAPDHLCFLDGVSRVLYCGDLAQRGTTVWIPYDLRGDLSDYLASLQRVLALGPMRLLPAHGDPIDDPEPVLRRYVEHRLARERQIVEVMREGATTADEITEVVYAALSEKMLPMAKQGVLAHLVKLERDGRARRDGEAWHIMSA